MVWLRLLRVFLGLCTICSVLVFIGSFWPSGKLRVGSVGTVFVRGVVCVINVPPGDYDRAWVEGGIGDVAENAQMADFFRQKGQGRTGAFFLNLTIPDWIHIDSPFGMGKSFVAVFIPLWIPTAIIAGAWLLLRWRVPPRFHGGLCEKCGYDIRPLGRDATCPECGWSRIANEDSQVLQNEKPTG